MKTASNTGEVKREALEGGNPLTTQISLQMLEKLVIKIRVHKGDSLQLLVVIGNRWVNFGKASTIYYLSDGDNAYMHRNYAKVLRLVTRGYLQVMGHGRYGSYQYAPTPAGLNVLRELCTII